MSLRDILDAVVGRATPGKAKVDDLFAISSAAITMEASLGLKPSSASGICFKPVGSSDFAAAQTEIEELLEYSSREAEGTYRFEKDEFNYRWAVFEGPDFEDLVTNVHLVSRTLIDHGMESRLLCAIFRFDNDHPVYWIYAFKHGTFYPFVPTGSRQRDNSLEFRIRSLLERELPVEKNVELWYPLWTIPF